MQGISETHASSDGIPWENCIPWEHPQKSIIVRVFLPFVTNPGTTAITILAMNSDHGVNFAGEEPRTMV